MVKPNVNNSAEKKTWKQLVVLRAAACLRKAGNSVLPRLISSNDANHKQSLDSKLFLQATIKKNG